jgi:hypothetical protein
MAELTCEAPQASSKSKVLVFCELDIPNPLVGNIRDFLNENYPLDQYEWVACYEKAQAYHMLVWMGIKHTVAIGSTVDFANILNVIHWAEDIEEMSFQMLFLPEAESRILSGYDRQVQTGSTELLTLPRQQQGIRH